MFDPGDYVEVTLLGEDRRLHGAIRHADAQLLLIAVSASDASYLQVGRPVQLAQSAPSGLYQMNTALLHCQNALFAVKREPYGLSQLRRNKRLSCDLVGAYWCDFLMEEVLMAGAQEGVPVYIRDLSYGGLSFVSKRSLEKGDSIGLKLSLTTGESLSGEGLVIRCGLQKTPDPQHPDYRYRIGAHFTRLSRMDQVKLQRFLILQAQSNIKQPASTK